MVLTMTTPNPGHIDGVDLDILEETFQSFEDAVSLALAGTIGAALAQGGGTPTLDDLNSVPTIWAQRVPGLAEKVRDVHVDAGNMQGAAVMDATGGPAGPIPDDITDPPRRILRQLDERGLPVFTSESDAALAVLEQATNRLVGIGDELWSATREQLLAGMDAGESIPKLAARVQDAAQVTDSKARTIARTEITSAANGGSIAYMRQTGLVSHKTWHATFGPRTRPTHAAASGQTVELDGKFSVGGSAMDHPGDPSAPASETANCRCVLLYVLAGDADTETAAAPPVEDAMPWSIVEDSPDCEDAQPFAVIQDDSGEVAGCHATETEAQAHIDALMAEEPGVSEVDALVAAAVAEMTGREVAHWAGVLCVIGEPTGDRRQFNAVSWAELPLPLRRNVVESHGGVPQTQAVLVGRIDEMEMRGNQVYGAGVIDLGSEAGREAARQMGTEDDPGFLRGVSIDADETPGAPATIELVYGAGCSDLGPDSTEAELAACMEPELMIWSDARIRGATLTDIPAIADANLYLTDGPDDAAPEVPEEEPVSEDDTADGPSVADLVEALTAAAHIVEIPDVPPAEWFDEPTDMPEFGAITITDEGRLFGYLAPANTGHRSYAGSGRRVTAPKGNVDYDRWMTRARVVQSGEGTHRIATGAVTMECGHAPTSGPGAQSAAASLRHYDDSCSLFATARVGENKHGTWIAGALLPDVTAAQVARALACELSGDWRPHTDRRGWREMVAALFVPVPGFAMGNRARVSMREGALVASTVPVRFGGEPECGPCVLAASAAEDGGRGNAARLIAASIGYDRADRARVIYESVRG